MDRKDQINKLLKDWDSNPRWKNVRRDYSAEDVVRLRGSFIPEYSLATKGANKLRVGEITHPKDLRLSKETK